MVGSADFPIIYKQGGFRLAALSHANWGKYPDNGRPTLSYMAILASAPISFQMRLQGLTVQSTIEAKLVAAILAMKEAAFCSIMVLELGSDESVGSVPIYIDNTSTLHVAGSHTYSPRAMYIALRYFSEQTPVEEGRVSVHYFKIKDQLAYLGTKHPSKHRHCHLMKLIDAFKA